jgi:hypothetical protein
MPIMPMRTAQEVPYQFSACVAMLAMDTQLTMVMVPLTAGLVTSSKWISIVWWEVCCGRVAALDQKNRCALVMSAKLLSSHGAQDITRVMGYWYWISSVVGDFAVTK